MDQPASLPPVPHGMKVSLQHDGVVWKRPLLDEAFAARAALVGGLAGLALPIGLITGAWAAVTAALVIACALGGVLLLQVPLHTQVHVSDRAVSVVVRRVQGSVRHRLPLDEIDVARVSPPKAEGGSGSLVLRRGEQVVSVGAGVSPVHLNWLLAAIELARAHHRRREGVEGREYGFMKKVPDSVATLTDRNRSGD